MMDGKKHSCVIKKARPTVFGRAFGTAGGRGGAGLSP